MLHKFLETLAEILGNEKLLENSEEILNVHGEILKSFKETF